MVKPAFGLVVGAGAGAVADEAGAEDVPLAVSSTITGKNEK